MPALLLDDGTRFRVEDIAAADLDAYENDSDTWFALEDDEDVRSLILELQAYLDGEAPLAVVD